MISECFTFRAAQNKREFRLKGLDLSHSHPICIFIQSTVLAMDARVMMPTPYRSVMCHLLRLKLAKYSDLVHTGGRISFLGLLNPLFCASGGSV